MNCDTVTIIHINQQTILNKLNSISCKEKQDQEKSDVENSTKYQEIVKIKDDLYKQTQVLQESLQKTRHECSLKEAELYHKLRTEKNKTIQIQQTNNELLKSLEHQIEIKQQVINSTNTSLDDIKLQCKSLEKDHESAQSEMISLKSHIGSVNVKSSDTSSWVLASKDEVDHPIKEDKKELKPTVTLIGTSNTNGIDPTRFTRKVSLTKEVKYTIETAAEFICDLDCAPDILIFHVLSNDIMAKSTHTCFEEFTQLISTTQEKFPNCKLILSCATNRRDSDLFNLKVNCINAMIQEHYHNVENVHIANSNILSRNGIISQRFIKSDGRHLSEEGVKVLASNLRLVVEGILGLTNSDTKNNNVHKREGYQYNRRSDTDNSYYDEHRYYPKRNRYNHGSEERWGDNYNYRYKYSDNREWSEGNSLRQRRQ